MPVYDWSQTADTHASADPAINYEIGMAPSAVGSSGRAAMAAYCGTFGAIEGGIRSPIPPYGLGTRPTKSSRSLMSCRNCRSRLIAQPGTIG
jgi:hypothetical protein